VLLGSKVSFPDNSGLTHKAVKHSEYENNAELSFPSSITTTYRDGPSRAVRLVEDQVLLFGGESDAA
jgi:hypothetical protein